MIIDFESKNMAWRFYLQIEWTCLYIAFVIAGVDVAFHVTNLRDIVYEDSEL